MAGWISADYHKTATSSSFWRAVRRVRKKIKTWQIFLLAATFLIFAGFFLRLNNLGMTERRNELIEADKTGDVKKVRKAALKLQNYMARHMNTATGKIALQTLYNRAAQETLNAAKPPEISDNLYMQAGEKCLDKLYATGYRAWSDCVAEKVGISDTSSLTVDFAPPDPSAYYVEFSSVRWSLDAAGITLFLALFLFAIVILRVAGFLFVRILINGEKT